MGTNHGNGFKKGHQVNTGRSHPRNVGWIRNLCAAHSNHKDSRFTVYPIETKGRINCGYCSYPARFVSIPNNLKII